MTATETIKIINPFTDIVIPVDPTINNQSSNTDKAWALGGGGANGLKADKSGMWFGSKSFVDAPFKIDMSGNVTAASLTLVGGTIKYAKSSFTDSAHAGYYIGAEGLYLGSASDVTKFKFTVATGAIDLVGTISGRSTATIASAINVSGVFINNLANANFDTSTKQILGDFTFGSSGAIKMITDSSNGLWISPNGILGKSGGVTTFAVDTYGNASFRGTVTITGGSGIASLSDAGSLATLSSVGASNCNSTLISGGKIITGLLTADNIQTGTLTGVLIQTSSSSYSGVKMSSSLGGIVIYGQTLEIRDTSNTLYGSMGGYAGYFNINAVSGRNMLIGANDAVVFFANNVYPLTNAVAALGSTTYRWNNVYTYNLDINGGNYYLNYNGSFSAIQSNSNFRVSGSVYLTGNMTFENYASLTIKDSGGTSRTLTCQYNATLGKYILSS